MIVYISIGNSDDKLTQAQWHEFVREVDDLLVTRTVHGRWFAAPDVPWQNACWCIEFEPDQLYDNSPEFCDWDGTWRKHAAYTRTAHAHLQRELRRMAARYQQDSIAWAHVPDPQFLRPKEPENDRHRETDRPAPRSGDGPEPLVRPAAPPAG